MLEVHGNLTDLRSRFYSAIDYSTGTVECNEGAGEEAQVGKGVVVQTYIPNPLLLKGHKSETRAYWVVVSVSPWIVLYHPGHVRLTAEK